MFFSSLITGSTQTPQANACYGLFHNMRSRHDAV